MHSVKQSVKRAVALMILLPIFLTFRSLAQLADNPSGANASAVAAAAYLLQPYRAFPQHPPYTAGTILPNHISQEEMDDTVRSFYRQWKKHYIKPGCRQGESYVWFEGTRGTNICVSEGQG
jgi:hypothetical protein